MEEYLHKTLIDAATPDMPFEELYYFINDLIVKKGFLNLDFLGNLGHSIDKNISMVTVWNELRIQMEG